MRRHSRHPGFWVSLAVLAVPVAPTRPRRSGSVQPQGESLKLTLGTKNFTESVITGELYAQALEDNGYQVVLRKNVGPTEVIDQELEDGDIDAYPEYLGLSATVVAGEDVEGKSAEDQRLARRFYESRGQAVSEETPFENVDAIATTFLFAQNHRLREIGDLRRLKSHSRRSARVRVPTAGLRRHAVGLPADQRGVRSCRHLRPVRRPLRGRRRRASFSRPTLSSPEGYRLLEDPERIFGYQHVALVIDDDKLATLGGDKFMDIINSVNEQLSQRTVIDLNAAVDLDEREPAEVAGQFLRQRGLIGAESE